MRPLLNLLAPVCLTALLTFVAPGIAGAASFEKPVADLIALGLPDTGGATYANVATAMGRYGEAPVLTRDYDGLTLEGNAWVRNGAGGVAEVVLHQTAIHRFEDPEKLSWKPADLEADIARIEKALGEKETEASPSKFLFAVQARRAGFEDSADRLIARLLSLSDEPDQLIENGTAMIAEHRYESACIKFFTGDLDWSDFGSELDKVVAQFSASWDKASAVARVRKDIDRAEGNMPLVDRLREVPIGDAAKNFLQRSSQQNWLLGSGEDLPEYPLVEVLGRGAAGIGDLIEMLDDDRAVRVPSGLVRSSRRRVVLEGSGTTSDRLYSELVKPIMASALAADLLRSALPIGHDAEGLKERATSWGEKVRDMSKEEIALSILELGSEQQKNNALEFLSASSSPAAVAAVEQSIFGETGFKALLAQFGRVQGIADTRKADAAALVTRYVDLFRKAAEAEPDELAKINLTLETFGGHLQSLQMLTSDQGLDVLIGQIVSGKAEISQAIHIIRQRVQESEEPVAAIAVLLDAALETAVDPEIRQALIFVAQFAQSIDGDTGKDPIFDTTLAPRWERLLDDTATFSNPLEVRALSVADAAIWVLASVAAKEGAGELNTAYNQFGEPLMGYLLDRKDEFLAGAPGVLPEVDLNRGSELASVPEPWKLGFEDRFHLHAALAENPDLSGIGEFAESVNVVAAADAPFADFVGRKVDPAMLESVAETVLSAAKEGRRFQVRFFRNGFGNRWAIECSSPDSYDKSVKSTIGKNISYYFDEDHPDKFPVIYIHMYEPSEEFIRGSYWGYYESGEVEGLATKDPDSLEEEEVDPDRPWLADALEEARKEFHDELTGYFEASHLQPLPAVILFAAVPPTIFERDEAPE